MTTGIQDRDFIGSVIPSSLLEQAIEWIASNLNPEDVFPDNVLSEWALRNGFVSDD